MKKFKYMSLHANESVMKEEAKGISQRKNSKNMKTLKISLVCLLTGMIAFSCKDDNDIVKDLVSYDKVTKSLTLIMPERFFPKMEEMQQDIENNPTLTREEKDAELVHFTKEQKDLQYRYLILSFSYTDYDGKKATYKLSKDEFLSKGFAASYYDGIISGIDIINNFYLTDEDLRECYEEQFPKAQKAWQEEAKKIGLSF